MQPLDALNFQYLEAALARVDLWLRRAVRRWRRAEPAGGDALRGLYVSDAEAEALLAQSAGWQQTMLPPDEQDAFDAALEAAEVRAQTLVDAAWELGATLRLEQLALAFDLDAFDLDVLLLTLAPALDLRYERLYGYLHDDITRKQLTPNLALELLCDPGAARLARLEHFAETAPLFKHRLLRRGADAGDASATLLTVSLLLDPAVLAWLLGRYHLPAELADCATFGVPEPDALDALLLAGRFPEIAAGDGAELFAVFYGPDALAQQAAARALAARCERPLLTLDLAALAAREQPLFPAARLALRDARLTGAALCLTGWDVCLGVEGRDSPPPELLAELTAHPGPVIAAGATLWRSTDVARQRRLLWLEFPRPDHALRQALWAHFLADAPRAAGVAVAALAGPCALTTAQRRAAAALALDHAPRGQALTDADLFAAARALSNPRLAALARKIAPRYSWDDIILPEDQRAQLREIVAAVRERPTVLDDWSVGRKLASSRGVTMLFAGEPGTGKTMAAEVIAAELGLELYKIDLSTVVSKYIGETEKNLERIFHEAEQSNAILFFDEADALFGKRSEVKDAHDRYANLEIAYLLQRMEAYDGVTILATNLRTNLDEAFVRRLHFIVEFPFPEEDDRLRIWQTLFPADVPASADIDLAQLARQYRLAGGNIRNILVSAAYLAAANGRQLTMRHLLHASRRELQKLGRLVGGQR